MLVEQALEGGYDLLLSVPLVLEYESVLMRPEHLDASGLQKEDIDALLNALAVIGDRVRLAYLWRPMLSDPKDDMVLETAVNGQAKVLVTLNSRHFQPAARTFGIDVLSPGEGLKRLRDENEEK